MSPVRPSPIHIGLSGSRRDETAPLDGCNHFSGGCKSRKDCSAPPQVGLSEWIVAE